MSAREIAGNKVTAAAATRSRSGWAGLIRAGAYGLFTAVTALVRLVSSFFGRVFALLFGGRAAATRDTDRVGAGSTRLPAAPSSSMRSLLDQDHDVRVRDVQGVDNRHADAVARAAIEGPANSNSKKEPPRRSETSGSGTALGGIILLEHGAAPFEFDQKNSTSYFVRGLDGSGVEQIIWGVDLKRAMEASGAKPGDRIVLEMLGKRPVTVDAHVFDAAGNRIGVEKREVLRNSWNVDVQTPGMRHNVATAVTMMPEAAATPAIATTKSAASRRANVSSFEEEENESDAPRAA